MAIEDNNSILVTKAGLMIIVGKIKGWLNKKLDIGGDAEVSSVIIDDNVSMSSSPATETGPATVIFESTAESETPAPVNLNSPYGKLNINKVSVRTLIDNSGIEYLLPHSAITDPVTSENTMNSENYGGTILTTRNRSFEKTGYTVNGSLSMVNSRVACIQNVYTSATVKSLYNLMAY